MVAVDIIGTKGKNIFYKYIFKSISDIIDFQMYKNTDYKNYTKNKCNIYKSNKEQWLRYESV